MPADPDTIFDPITNQKILDMYAEGYGIPSIAMRLRLVGSRVNRFLEHRGVMRKQLEGLKLRSKLDNMNNEPRKQLRPKPGAV